MLTTKLQKILEDELEIVPGVAGDASDERGSVLNVLQEAQRHSRNFLYIAAAMAALLFLIMAEKSLTHRQKNLNAMRERLDQVEAENLKDAPHLAPDLRTDWVTYETLNSEADSIQQRDYDHIVFVPRPAPRDCFQRRNALRGAPSEVKGMKLGHEKVRDCKKRKSSSVG